MQIQNVKHVTGLGYSVHIVLYIFSIIIKSNLNTAVCLVAEKKELNCLLLSHICTYIQYTFIYYMIIFIPSRCI